MRSKTATNLRSFIVTLKPDFFSINIFSYMMMRREEKKASRVKSASILQSGSDDCRKSEGKYCCGKKIRRVCVLLWKKAKLLVSELH